MRQININDKIYEVIETEEGPAFKPNNLLLKIQISFDISISQIWKLYYLGAITKMDLLNYYIGLGHLVGAVEELLVFEDYKFEWVDDGKVPS